MTRSLKLTALAGMLAAAFAAPAWSQPSSTTAAPSATMPSSNSVMSGTTSTSTDPYDPSNTQLRDQCLDTTTNTWKTTAQCEVFIRNGIAPPVVSGGSATTGANVGSTSSLNNNSAISGSTTRSTTGTTSSLNPSMSSSGTAGTGTSGSTSGTASGSAGTTGSTSGSATGSTSGTSGGSGH